MARVSALYIHPVKGMHRLAVDEAYVERRGLRDDRRWMVVDAGGLFQSQRNLSSMARFQPTPIENGLRISHNGSSIEVETPSSGAREVTVWKSTVTANDAGDEVAAWLTEKLQTTCRLVHMPDSTRRPCGEEDEVSFADGFPLLLANEASLADLNSRLDEPIPITRFRPNVVMSDAEPWAEDVWTRLSIGGLPFRNPKPCARCLVTTLDPETGESGGQEPLRTLATFRLIDGKAMFATNLIPDAEGWIRVGDEVSAIEFARVTL